jgi:hypothetical protein
MASPGATFHPRNGKFIGLDMQVIFILTPLTVCQLGMSYWQTAKNLRVPINTTTKVKTML